MKLKGVSGASGHVPFASLTGIQATGTPFFFSKSSKPNFTPFISSIKAFFGAGEFNGVVWLELLTLSLLPPIFNPMGVQ